MAREPRARTRNQRNRFEAQIPTTPPIRPRDRDATAGDHRVETVPGIGMSNDYHHQIFCGFSWQTVCIQTVYNVEWIDGIAQTCLSIYSEAIHAIETAVGSQCPRLDADMVTRTILGDHHTSTVTEDSDADGQRGTRSWLEETMREMTAQAARENGGRLPEDFRGHPSIPGLDDLTYLGEVQPLTTFPDIPDPRPHIEDTEFGDPSVAPLDASERAELARAVRQIQGDMTEEERGRMTEIMGSDSFIRETLEAIRAAEAGSDRHPGSGPEVEPPQEPHRPTGPGPDEPNLGNRPVLRVRMEDVAGVRDAPSLTLRLPQTRTSRINLRIDREFDVRTRAHRLAVMIDIPVDLVESPEAAGLQPLIDSLGRTGNAALQASTRMHLLADALAFLERNQPGLAEEPEPEVEPMAINSAGKRDVDL